MLYLFVALKLPIVAAGLIVWWAVRSSPENDEVPEGETAGRRSGRTRPAACRAPRGAGRTATRCPCRRRGSGACSARARRVER